ncbi:GL10046 [Drosophila persimilis]|uniref:GL10046 n=1 Tax=Drosophila persimilis TaxID=7234 RepID=B4HDG4_DROPE|nr:GL10046 [Drosophila persimilis]
MMDGQKEEAMKERKSGAELGNSTGGRKAERTAVADDEDEGDGESEDEDEEDDDDVPLCA